jgi:hypothetical protein
MTRIFKFANVEISLNFKFLFSQTAIMYIADKFREIKIPSIGSSEM